MPCPACGTEQSGWGRHCTSCGTELADPGLVCGGCGAANPVGSRFCSGCGQKLELLLCLHCGTRNTAERTTCAQCQTPLRPTAAAEGSVFSFPSSENHPWTSEVHFYVRVVPQGIADLVHSLPQEAARYLETFHGLMAEVARDHEGTLWEAEDGGALISFPCLTDDRDIHALNAVEAARSAKAALREFSEERTREGWSPMAERIAVYQGEYLATDSSRSQGVMTRVENEGPELIKLCPAGEVCLSETVQKAVRRHYLDRPVGLIGRGDAPREGAYLLGAPRPRLPGSEGSALDPTPLVGRDRELSHIKRRWADVVRGGGSRFLTLLAAPGLGRTRLLEAFLKSVRSKGQSFLVTSCEESTSFAPYHPLVDIILQLLSVTSDDDDDTVALRLLLAARDAVAASEGWTARHHEPDIIELSVVLGELLGIDVASRERYLEPAILDSESLRQRIFFSVSRLLRGQSHAAPLVIVIEDVHQADSATLDLIQYLGAMLRGGGNLFIVCSGLPTFVELHPNWGKGWWRHETLSLSAVGGDEIERLVRSVLGISARESVVHSIVRQSHGKPGIAELLARAWLDEYSGGHKSSPRRSGEDDVDMVISTLTDEAGEKGRAEPGADGALDVDEDESHDELDLETEETSEDLDGEEEVTPAAEDAGRVRLGELDVTPGRSMIESVPGMARVGDTAGGADARRASGKAVAEKTPGGADSDRAPDDAELDAEDTGVDGEDTEVDDEDTLEEAGVDAENDSESLGVDAEDDPDHIGVDAEDAFSGVGTGELGSVADAGTRDSTAQEKGADVRGSNDPAERDDAEMDDLSDELALDGDNVDRDGEANASAVDSDRAAFKSLGGKEAGPKKPIVQEPLFTEEDSGGVNYFFEGEGGDAPNLEEGSTVIMAYRGDDEDGDEDDVSDEVLFDADVDPLGELQHLLPGEIWARRLRELSAEARRLLSLASVGGRTFRGELLVAQWKACDEDETALEALLGEIRSLGLIRKRIESHPWQVSWRFRSTLLQQIVYEALPLADRHRLHRQLARLLETEGIGARVRVSYALVAHHYDQGNESDRALRYYVMAGKAAKRALAPSEGERLFRRALSLVKETGFPDGGNESIALHHMLGQVLRLLNEPKRAFMEFETALEYARVRQDARLECEVLMSLCDLLDREGDHSRVMDLAVQARDVARESRNARMVVQSLRRIGWEHLRAGRNEEGQAALEDAVQVALETGKPEQMAMALDSLGAFYYLRGNYGLAVRGYEDLLGLIKRSIRKRGPS